MAPNDLDLLYKLTTSFNDPLVAGQGDVLSADLSKLLCRWCRALEREDGSVTLPRSRKDAGLWHRFQIQLEKLPPEDLRVKPLGLKLSISERHLRQKFHDQFGLPLGTYLRNYRIRRAIGLLVTSDLSIAEIADQCGYRSSASFHRAFMVHTGVKPGGFRKGAVPLGGSGKG